MEHSLILAQSDQIIGWLTPVWVMSVGISLGLILVYLCKGLIYLLSRIPGLNTLNDAPVTRMIGGISIAVLTLIAIFAAAFGQGWLGRQTDGGDITLWILLGLLISIVMGFGFTAVVSKKRFDELGHQPVGNFASWLTKIAIGFVGFAILGIVLALFDGFGSVLIVEEPIDKLNSLQRLNQTGFQQALDVNVPAKTTHEIDTSFYGQELRLIQFRSDQDVLLAAQPFDGLGIDSYFEVFKNSEYTSYRRQVGDQRIPAEEIQKLFIKNDGDFDASVDLQWITQVEHPQMGIIPRIAVGVLAIYLGYWMFCAGCPKIAAIALSTFKTEITQPVFALIAIIGGVFAVVSIYIPYYTFGEDIKMYKMSALTLIRILGIFVAIWAASKSVAEEIEGRTALTVLSKPVGRRQFLLGKFSGISTAIGLMFVVVGLWFVIWVCYKPIYDARETSGRDFAWVNGFDEAVKTIPGLILAYFESLVFVAISIAVSTRLGILANFMVCFAIYVLGHLTPLIVQSAEVVQAFEPVVVFGQFISVVFPVLDHFDVETAIIGDVDVPLSYMAWACIYCLIYGTIAMLLSLVLFEDRDLA